MKLSREMFTSNKPILNQSGYHYVIAKKDCDLSKVKIAHLFYPTEILETDRDQIPYMYLVNDKEDKVEVNSKDYLFGPEVTVPINVCHLELLLEAIDESKLLIYNSDYLRLKEKLRLKKSGKDYSYAFGKGLLYDLEERETIIIEEETND